MRKAGILAFLILLISCDVHAQVYLTGTPDYNPRARHQIIWKSENVSCELDSFRDTRRSNSNGGGYVTVDAEIAYHPNGKLYLIDDLMDLYEPHSRFHYYYKNFDFSPLSIDRLSNGGHGAVFDKNGILYFSGRWELFKYDMNTGEATILADSSTNYIPSSDLAFMDGELIGTGLLLGDTSTYKKIVRYPEGDWGNPEELIDLDTIHNFREGLRSEHMHFMGIIPVSDYCDTTQVYALYGRGDFQSMDSIYYWHVKENRLEPKCLYPHRIFGVTSTTEVLFSEPCIVYIDLDIDNSSGAWGQSYRDTVQCYLNSVAITDEDVEVRSPFRVDSIRICLSITGDSGLEKLGVQSSLPPTVSSYMDDNGCLWLINKGDADLEDFEEALRRIRFIHLGNTFTPGGRQIEIVGFAGGDSSQIVRADIQAYNPIQGLGPDRKSTICQGESLTLQDSILIDTLISWSSNALGGIYTGIKSGTDTVMAILTQETCPDDTLLFEIEVIPSPEEIEEESYFICADDSINYTLEIDRDKFIAVWNNTDTTFDFTLRSGKAYMVEIFARDDPRCRSISTVATIEHTPDITKIDTLLCPTQSLIYRDSVITEAGVYDFELADNSPKCSDIIRLNVMEAPSEGHIRPLPDSCLWDELRLEIMMDSICNISWNNGSQTSVILIDRAGEYSAEWQYQQQCNYSAGITILDCEGSNIYVPNVFSPNGDGINDIFTVEGNNFHFLHLGIYDRWGNKLFETRNRFTGWDGNLDGQDAATGVYIFLFEYINARGDIENMSGSITLVR